MRRSSNNSAIMLTLAALVLAVPALPGGAIADEAESNVAAEIRALIQEGNEFTAKNLEDQPGGVSKDGSVEFWSSGGLMQWAAPDQSSSKYEQFSITAKHIKVIELPGGEAAIAMYYSEGSMHGVGRAPISNYRTRVTQVFVKEDGNWVVRAAHWSPIAGGSGTNQVSVD